MFTQLNWLHPEQPNTPITEGSMDVLFVGRSPFVIGV